MVRRESAIDAYNAFEMAERHGGEEIRNVFFEELSAIGGSVYKVQRLFEMLKDRARLADPKYNTAYNAWSIYLAFWCSANLDEEALKQLDLWE